MKTKVSKNRDIININKLNKIYCRPKSNFEALQVCILGVLLSITFVKFSVLLIFIIPFFVNTYIFLQGSAILIDLKMGLQNCIDKWNDSAENHDFFQRLFKIAETKEMSSFSHIFDVVSGRKVYREMRKFLQKNFLIEKKQAIFLHNTHRKETTKNEQKGTEKWSNSLVTKKIVAKNWNRKKHQNLTKVFQKGFKKQIKKGSKRERKGNKKGPKKD